MTPLSVAVIALVGGARLQACVDALLPHAAEVLVVAPIGTRLAHSANLTLITVDASVPEKRRMALHAATRSVVAFIEDTCLPPPDWCASMYASFEDARTTLVCGSITIAQTLRPQYRALAITEYAPFQAESLLPGGLAEARCTTLNGANFALRKESVAPAPAQSFVDGALFKRLSDQGDAIAVASAVATYVGEDRFGALLSTRYHHGRIYGSSVVAGRTIPSRIALVAKGFAAPIVRFGRNCRYAPAWFWRAPTTILWVIAMNLAWGVGEVVGSLTGSEGSSLNQWR